MRSRFALLLQLVITSLCLPLSADTTNSIVDQAAASSEVRSNLIAHYERSKVGFKDDRLLAVAVGYTANGQLELAKPVYLSFLKDHPNHEGALRSLGSVCTVQENFAEAIKYLKKAWELGDTASLGNLGLSYYRSDRFQELELLLPDLIKHKENDAVIVNCLLAYALLKNVPRESLLLEALEGLPDKDLALHEDTLFLAATAANRLKSYDENNKTLNLICQKIIRGYLADTNAWPKASLPGVGEAYFLSGDCSNAEAIYKEVLRSEPDNGRVLLGLGSTYLCLRKFPEAVIYLDKAWKAGNTNALRNLAAAYWAVHDLSGLQSLIPKMLEQKDEDIEILNTIVVYALAKEPKDRTLFYQAIDGLTDARILRREDTANVVIMGLTAFGDTERIKRILDKKKELDKGLRG